VIFQIIKKGPINEVLSDFTSGCFLSSISSTTFASPPTYSPENLYFSASIGASKVSNFDNYDTEEGDPDEVYESDESEIGTAFSLSLGYKFDVGIFTEIGYLNLGETSTEETEKQIDNSGAVLSEDIDGIFLKPSGFTLGVGYELPLSDSISLTGKIGMFIWDLDVEREDTHVDQATGEKDTESESESSDGTDLYFGVGAVYKSSEKLHLFAEWSRYQFEFSPEGIDLGYDHDADYFAIGVRYFFGAKTSTTSSTPPQSRDIGGVKSQESNRDSSLDLTACDEKHKHLFFGCN